MSRKDHGTKPRLWCGWNARVANPMVRQSKLEAYVSVAVEIYTYLGHVLCTMYGQKRGRLISGIPMCSEILHVSPPRLHLESYVFSLGDLRSMLTYLINV